ncbi:hypothetical protein [Lewinella sp. 4G2]|uniref:hypothetical protein n=1 Tax=Lewinella sp. 4G2 TaxID=1803372 RepID=UPI0007B4A853|nr:hypothetical protein [Lewinella sp. 4G2]OAV44112.1 hypothetical protein A3850_006185 [Lewinella sp. 4G2]
MQQTKSHYVALGGLVIFLALYALTQFGYMGPNPIGSTSRATAPLIVPSGYAFAIWGPIYLGLIAFPIYQWIKKRDEHPAWVEVRYWYAANVVANGIWLVLASYDQVWTTVAVIVFMLFSLFRINRLLDVIESSQAPISYWLERFAFYIYFGWVTLATVLNVASDLKFTGWNGAGISEVTWTLVMSCIAAAIAGFTAWTFRSAAYAGVVVWAFIALALKHINEVSAIFYSSVAVVAIFAILMIALLGRGRRQAVA